MYLLEVNETMNIDGEEVKNDSEKWEEIYERTKKTSRNPDENITSRTGNAIRKRLPVKKSLPDDVEFSSIGNREYFGRIEIFYYKNITL